MAPFPEVLAHHLLLVATIAALGAAGLRLAALAADRGPERFVAAVVLAAAIAVVCALGLGLAGWGGSAAALAGSAAAAWLAARVAWGRPEPSLGSELGEWWAGLGRGGRVAAGALAGAGGAYLAWLTANPSLGEDGLVYHLTEAVLWVREGTPGSIEPITYEFPVGSYPVTNEVLLAWGSGISRGLSAALMWTPAVTAVGALAGWSALRRLQVERLPAALAVAAVCTLPVAIDQLRGPSTDLPALAWLVAAGALALASKESPRLIYPAIVAGALSVGTKTTTLPFVLAVLAPALWVRRPLAVRPLVVALTVAMAVAGVWYLRNLVQHGSPFWPFVATAWGDPVPSYLDRFDATFLGAPRATVSGRVDEYLAFLGAGPLLLAAGLASPLLTRTRAVAAAAAATAVGLLVWARSPYTGNAGVHPVLDLSLATTRYLLPVFAAAALAVALASRRGGGAGRAATGVLAVALAWNLIRDAGLGLPRAPDAWLIALGAVAGAAVATAAARLPRRDWAVGGAAAAALAVALAVGASGFDRRFGEVPGFSGPLVAWAEEQERFRDGDLRISFAPTPIAPLAGAGIQNRLELIPADASCRDVRRRAREGWVVIRDHPLKRFLHRFTAAGCLRDMRPVFDDGNEFRVYATEPQRGGG